MTGSPASSLELVRSLGADHVIDYTAENFTEDSSVRSELESALDFASRR